MLNVDRQPDESCNALKGSTERHTILACEHMPELYEHMLRTNSPPDGSMLPEHPFEKGLLHC